MFNTELSTPLQVVIDEVVGQHEVPHRSKLAYKRGAKRAKQCRRDWDSRFVSPMVLSLCVCNFVSRSPSKVDYRSHWEPFCCPFT